MHFQDILLLWLTSASLDRTTSFHLTLHLIYQNGILVLNILGLSLIQTALKCQCVMHMFCLKAIYCS